MGRHLRDLNPQNSANSSRVSSFGGSGFIFFVMPPKKTTPSGDSIGLTSSPDSEVTSDDVHENDKSVDRDSPKLEPSYNNNSESCDLEKSDSIIYLKSESTDVTSDHSTNAEHIVSDIFIPDHQNSVQVNPSRVKQSGDVISLNASPTIIEIQSSQKDFNKTQTVPYTNHTPPVLTGTNLGEMKTAKLSTSVPPPTKSKPVSRLPIRKSTTSVALNKSQAPQPSKVPYFSLTNNRAHQKGLHQLKNSASESAVGRRHKRSHNRSRVINNLKYDVDESSSDDESVDRCPCGSVNGEVASSISRNKLTEHSFIII